MSKAKVRTEEFRVSGEGLLAKFKELVHEGNVRRAASASKTRRAKP
jgi:hypothetical protein